MLRLLARDHKELTKDATQLPLVFLDNNVCRALTTKAKPGFERQVETTRLHILKIMNELGIAGPVEFLPTAASLLEYSGIAPHKIARPPVPAFQRAQTVSERIELALRGARDFYSTNPLLTRQAVVKGLDTQLEFSESSPLTANIDGAFRSLAGQDLFEEYLREALALDFCFGLDDFGEPPSDLATRSVKSDEIEWTPRQSVLIEAERLLLRMGLRTRRTRPCAIGRRIWSMAQLFIKPEILVNYKGENIPILQMLALGGRDNLGDLDYLDFAILGWSDRAVVSITTDNKAEAGARAAALWSIYRQLYAWWSRNGEDMSQFPRITPGKLISIEDSGQYHILNLNDVDGEIGEDKIFRVKWDAHTIKS